MCIFCCALLLSFMSVTAARAEFGKSGWPILRKVQSAQFRGISASAPDYANISGVFYNPAIGGIFDSKEILVMSEKGLSDDALGAFVYGIPLDKWMIAFGGAYYDAGSIELNWFDNNEIKTENVSLQRDMLGLFVVERKLSDAVFAGLSLKGLSSELAQRVSATAYAADIGLYIRPVASWSLSLACQNIGASTKFINYANPLPAAGYLGTALMWRSPEESYYAISQMGATYFLVDQKIVPEVGCEIGGGPISVNFGFRSGVDEGNVHIGTEICIGSMVFGYAYSPSMYLDAIHRVTVAWRFFNSPVRPMKPSVVEEPKPAVPLPLIVKPETKPAAKPKTPARPVKTAPVQKKAPVKASPAKTAPAAVTAVSSTTTVTLPQVQQRKKRNISDYKK